MPHSRSENSVLEARGPSGLHRGRIAPAIVLLVFASFRPLGIWAANFVGVGHWERLVLISAVLWLLAVLAWTVLIRFGVRSPTALIAVAGSLLFVVAGSQFTSGLGRIPGLSFFFVAFALALVIVSRISDHRPLWVAIVVATVYVASGPAISAIQSATSFGHSDAIIETALEVELTRTPDIFLVVLDGYAASTEFREETSAKGIGPAVYDDLEALEFTVFRSAWSAYPTTETSVASLLNMAYVLEDGAGYDTATNRDLYASIGGDNPFNNTLRANGYSTTMVESGWSGSSCGAVDTCISAHFLDESVFWTLEHSPLRQGVLSRYGYSFTAGAQHSMDWLLNNAETINRNGVSDFVFGHVMAPHPPFFLNGECDVVFEDARSGVQFARPRDTVDDRAPFFNEQANCIDSFMLSLGDLIDDETVVIFVADHGTDARNQLVLSSTDWGPDEIDERMRVFLAMSEAGCDFQDGVVLPEVLAMLLECLSGVEQGHIEQRIFIGEASGTLTGRSVRELSPDQVRQLVDS
jgi:uncharacterized membrane protein